MDQREILSTRMINLANGQIDRVHQVLVDEIENFLNNPNSSTQSGPFKPISNAWESIKWLKDNLAEKYEEIKKEDSAEIMRKKDAKIMANESTEGVVSSLSILFRKAEIIRYSTKIWVLNLQDWENRWGLNQSDSDCVPPIPSSFNAVKTAEYAEIFVNALYDMDKIGKNNLKTLQFPVVVPFMIDLYATNFDFPRPIIVAPRWGHQQVWTWLSYAHEVGHHVYRNVKGLKDELRVHLSMTLFSKKYPYEVQRIWFNWLEEVFADIFSILRLGAAFIRSQQYVLIILDSRIIKRVSESNNDRDGMMYAFDDTHPVPYIRVFLAIKALQQIEPDNTEINEIRMVWEGFFSEIDTDYLKLLRKPRENMDRMTSESREYINMETQQMEDSIDTVLQVILETPLYSLESGGKTRTLKEVFYAAPAEREIDNALNAIRNGFIDESKCFGVLSLMRAIQYRLKEFVIHASTQWSNPVSVSKFKTMNEYLIKVIRELYLKRR